MIDLSLSQIEVDEQNEELLCKYHKRNVIAFCIQPDCHQSERFACPSCLNHPDIHFNHKIVESKDMLLLIKGGIQKFKSQLTSRFDLLMNQIITQIQQNLKRFVYKKAENIASRFDNCFLGNLSVRDSKFSESLLRLYEFKNSINGNYIDEICEIRGEKIKQILKNEIEEFKIFLNEKEFDQELQRFDIENQVIHNLSKEALDSYQRYKHEQIFKDLSCENEIDSKLYMVNDRNFYTVSQFNKEGQRHGRTIEIPSHSHYYQGYLDQGKRNGKGVYIYEDGTAYIGMFKNNKKEGQGRLVKSDGYVYTGEWKNDEKNGAGEERFQDIWIFEGFFENNLRSGPGQETNKQIGKVIQAIYEKGEIGIILSQVQGQPQRNEHIQKKN